MRKINKNLELIKNKNRKQDQNESKRRTMETLKNVTNGTYYKKCIIKFQEYAKITQRKGNNIERQFNVVNRTKMNLDNKRAKKGDFMLPYKTLLEAMGGNEKSLKCAGKTVRNSSVVSPKGRKESINFAEYFLFS